MFLGYSHLPLREGYARDARLGKRVKQSSSPDPLLVSPCDAKEIVDVRGLPQLVLSAAGDLSVLRRPIL